MRQSVEGLWPDRIRRPWRRLALAMLCAPLVLAVLLTLTVTLLAGPAGELPVVHAGRMAIGFLGALLLFTLPFGTAGVAVLWSAGQRSAAAWGVVGGLLGAIFGMGHGILTRDQVRELEMMHATLLGLALFLLIRWFAGVREAAAD